MSCTVQNACNEIRSRRAEVAASDHAADSNASSQPVIDAQQQAADLASKASENSVLRAGAETAAFELSAELTDAQALATAGRWREAETALKKIDARLQQYRTMEPIPPEISPIEKLFQERKKQVVHVLIPMDLSTSLEKWFAEGEVIVSDATTQDFEAWLAATKVWEQALVAAITLEQMDDIQRPHVHPQLKQIRRKLDARLKKAGRVLQPYFKQQALIELCGPAPAGCGEGWDGECIGAESAFKRIAHDPGSVDVENCSQPEFSNRNCWVSTCEVRAKNMLGAKIRSVHKFSFSTLGVEVLG